MNRKFPAFLLTILFFCSWAIALDAKTPAPGASSCLAGTPESFLASCRGEREQTKKQIAELKATKARRDAIATLQACGSARLIGGRARARPGLAKQANPS